MLRLAYNEKAALFKCRKEFWIVTSQNFQYFALNENSDHYGPTNALDTFVEQFGLPTWVRRDLLHWLEKKNVV